VPHHDAEDGDRADAVDGTVVVGGRRPCEGGSPTGCGRSRCAHPSIVRTAGLAWQGRTPPVRYATTRHSGAHRDSPARGSAAREVCWRHPARSRCTDPADRDQHRDDAPPAQRLVRKPSNHDLARAARPATATADAESLEANVDLAGAHRPEALLEQRRHGSVSFRRLSRMCRRPCPPLKDHAWSRYFVQMRRLSGTVIPCVK